MKIVISILAWFIVSGHAYSQSRYIDRTGRASFYSKAPLEDIEAHTDQALSLLDISTGEVAVSMLMKSFQFEKALMQEHFNEKYVESDKYPKGSFKGKVTDIHTLDPTKDGQYTLEAEGEITIHGQTNALKATIDFVVSNGTIRANSVFPLRVKDFKIQIPSLVVKNIAEVVEVKVAFQYQSVSN